MVIFWHRRDLRIYDNKGLIKATKLAQQNKTKVISIYCLDPRFFEKQNKSEYRNQFFLESLAELHKTYEEQGSNLIILPGDPLIIIPKLISSLPSTPKAIVWNKDYNSYSRKRDTELKKLLNSEIETFQIKDSVIFEGNEIEKNSGGPYSVYTPYKNKWKEKLEIEGGIDLFKPASTDKTQLINYQQLANLNLNIKEVKLSEWLDNFTKNEKIEIKSGRKAALKRLAEFTNKNDGLIKLYKHNRDRADLDGTSKLSPHFKFGNISIREAYYQSEKIRLDQENTLQEKNSIATWQSELIWREFYYNILANFPEVENLEFQKKYRNLNWIDDNKIYENWKQGKTGFPFIDASMRQLNTTGWMHNRGRMAVAMFLTKDLHMDWRLGEKHFHEKLVDLDIASNNGGWQWSASTGTDAAPYFRIFNPVSQGEKCDPNGDFVRKWLPELSKIPGKKIHQPWKLTPMELAEYNIELGKDYPHRMVNHKEEREKAIQQYKEINS